MTASLDINSTGSKHAPTSSESWDQFPGDTATSSLTMHSKIRRCLCYGLKAGDASCIVAALVALFTSWNAAQREREENLMRTVSYFFSKSVRRGTKESFSLSCASILKDYLVTLELVYKQIVVQYPAYTCLMPLLQTLTEWIRRNAAFSIYSLENEGNLNIHKCWEWCVGGDVNFRNFQPTNWTV